MRIVVAGASGYLGRHVVEQAHRRGHRVRALVRDRSRAESPGPWGAPALTGLVDEWAVGEVSDESFVADICDGADSVISALGVTRQKAYPWDIDYHANRSILHSAQRYDLDQFCYVNVLHSREIDSQLTRAKSAFVQALQDSPITHQIMNPSGYFSDMGSMMQTAQRGRAYLLRPNVRVNPIHGADLASACIKAQERGNPGSWDLGGPDVFTWDEIAHCAFDALERPAKITVIPPKAVYYALKVLGVVNPRMADTLTFTTWSLTHDCVGEPTGVHHLRDFYREQAHNL